MIRGARVSKDIGGFLNKKSAEKVDPKDIEGFYEIFTALSLQTGCPKKESDRYFLYMVSRLRSERNGFLKILAALPVLGLRVLGNDIPLRHEYLLPTKRNGLPKPFGWYFGRLRSLSMSEPNRTLSTASADLCVRRLLTVLSIGKMLTISSTRGKKKALEDYVLRIASKTFNESNVTDYDNQYGDEFDEFLRFTNFEPTREPLDTPGANPVEGEVFLDPTCYSLKSLSKRSNREFLSKIPYAVYENLLRVNEVNERFVCPPDRFDGRLMILVEKGGKYRGICPYLSPLVHSTTVYRACRNILHGFIPDVSLDQSVGHERARLFSLESSLTVSADASAFTDSLDLDLLEMMTRRMGEKGFLTYVGNLKIASPSGLITSQLPLMGLKGCYELGCVALAFSLWKHSRDGMLSLNGMAHANDDLCCSGIPDGVKSAYEFIGAGLNTRKTVCSNSVSTFCGKMFWKGYDVSPINFNITQYHYGGPGSELCNSARDFINRAVPVWGPRAFNCALWRIKAGVIKAVGVNNVIFSLPTKIGGFFATERFDTAKLIDRLSSKSTLRYALYNCPFEDEVTDRTTSMIAYVRLGEKATMPDGTVLPSITIPSTERATWIRRKLKVDKLLATEHLSELDVYEYIYSDTSIAV